MRNRPCSKSLIRAALMLTAVVGLIAPSAAFADEATPLKVVPLAVDGDSLDAKSRADILDALVQQLQRYPHYTVLPAHTGDLIELMMDHECVDVDDECLGKIAKAKGADLLFYVDIAGSEAKGLVVKPYVYDVSAAKIVFREFAATKKVVDLADVVRDRIVAAIGAPPVTEGTLVVKANNGGAQIFINGEFAGTGGVTLERPAGDYAIRVTADGFEEMFSNRTVVGGQTVSWEMEMNRLEGATLPPPRQVEEDDGGVHWAVWAVVGAVVVAGVVTGVVLATSDDDTSGPRGPVTLSIDGQNAWRDAAIVGGRP